MTPTPTSTAQPTVKVVYWNRLAAKGHKKGGQPLNIDESYSNWINQPKILSHFWQVIHG
jgi:hypothetical protein